MFRLKGETKNTVWISGKRIPARSKFKLHAAVSPLFNSSLACTHTGWWWLAVVVVGGCVAACATDTIASAETIVCFTTTFLKLTATQKVFSRFVFGKSVLGLQENKDNEL